MRKPKPYLKQSRNARNKQWITIKNMIRRDEHGNGGLFYSYDYLGDGCDWVDFYFLGKNPTIFYNACLTTPHHALYEMISEIASDNAEKLIPHTVELLKPSKRKESYEMSEIFKNSDDTADMSKFAGLQRYQWIQKEGERLVQDNVYSVASHVKLKHDYVTGIGLEGICDAPLITKEIIDEFIIDFLERGEQAYIANTHYSDKDVMDMSQRKLSNSVLSDLL